MPLYAGVSRIGIVMAAIALLAGLPSHPLSAQSDKGTPAVRLFGTSRISSQYADIRGAYQGLPTSFARWEFDPSIALWGIPFSGHLFLTSERDRFGETINTFNFNFSIRSSDLQQYIRRRVEDRIEALRASGEAAVAGDTTLAPAQSIADSLQEGAQAIDEAQQQAEQRRAEVDRQIAQLEELRDIRDSKLPEQVKKLEQMGVISGTEQFLLNFPYIGVGMNHPNYSPLTLSGLAVNGLDMEFNPGKFYLAFSYGKSEKPVQVPAIITPATPVDSLLNPDSLVNRTYDRRVIAGRIGYGRKAGDHVFFTMMHARDDAASVAFDTNNTIFTPKENLLLGLEIRFLGFDENLSLDGEIVGSVLTDNTNGAPLEDNNDIPSFLTDLIEPKLSTHVDYAYALRLQYAIPESYTRLSGSVRMIGPGFSSLGVPFLRNDLFRYEARIDQGFLRRQITVGGFYRHERDNLIPWKRSTTTLDGYGVNFGLNFRDYPYLQLLVAPYLQRNNAEDAYKLNNRTLLVSAATGYSYRIGTLLGTTNLSYALQTSKTQRAEGDFGSATYTLNQSVGFSFPLLLSAGVGMTNQEYTQLDNTIIFVDASASYTFADNWTTTAGATFMSEENGDRTGYYLGASLPLWQLGTLDVRAERNAFSNAARLYLDAPPEEFILRASLSTNW